MLVVASIFRNAEEYIPRYFEQVDALRELVPLRLVVAEGDSTDDTLTLLERYARGRDTVLKVDHGGPEFGSVDNQIRWAQIAYVCNTVLDHLQMKNTDRLIYVESDLIWAPETMLRLYKNLDTIKACAAMSYVGQSDRFYDIWGHRGLDGERFVPEFPYHPSLARLPDGRLTGIGSAGSCIAVRGEVVNAGVRFSNEDGILGFCRTIRDHGALWLDTGAEVFHP